MPHSPAIAVRRFPSRADLNAALVERLDRAITTSVPAGAAVMLSGGNTPMPAYRELAGRTPHSAPNLSVLFSDDRYVPSTAEASNYHQSLPLINVLGLPESSVLRVRTELPLEEAAADYERRLDALLLAGVSFRLGLLGLGADGHTASLFTAQDLERARGRRAIPVSRPDGMQAVSVTPEVLAHFAELIFVVAGQDKHNALQCLINQDPSLTAFCAIQSRATTDLWVADS
jgi:6-phosphogluconolactonase/glucosamine-6-phosphate isomerase/deaminase